MSELDSDIRYPSNSFYPPISAAFRKADPVKVILLGNSDVGKSSIIAYLKDGVSIDDVKQSYTPKTLAPIPVGDVRVRTEHGEVKLSLWDTCGSEKYFSVTPQFLRGAKAVVFVYDISDKESLDCIFSKPKDYKSWLGIAALQFSGEDFQDMPVAVLGHKADLSDARRTVNTEEAKTKLVKEAEAGRLPKDYMFWETSAKTGLNLKEFVVKLAERFPSNSQVWMTGSNCVNEVEENSALNVSSSTFTPSGSINRATSPSSFSSSSCC